MRNTQWNNLGISDKNILNTSKIFYGKYLFRAELTMFGAYQLRSIRSQTLDTFKKQINSEIASAKKKLIDTSGYYRDYLNNQANMNAVQLWTMYEACDRHKNKIRTRAEDNTFNIYTETEEQLIDILSYSKKYISSHINNIHRPANEQAKIMLANKVIFVKNPKFKFKVMIGGSRYQYQNKKQILSYLDNFGDSVCLVPSLKKYLLLERSTYLTGYMYLNDLTILTFLQMISPEFVGKIFKLERAIQ